MSRPRDRLTIKGNTYHSAMRSRESVVLKANTAKQITQIRTGPLSSGEKPRLFPGARSPRAVTALGVLAEMPQAARPGQFPPIDQASV
jgi:hypothetical protein